MKYTFGKIEKLKSKKEIEFLFAQRNSVSQFPIRLFYRKTAFNDPVKIKVGVSVSKKYFKKAVDRNRVKRLLRESYRKNKYLVLDNTTHQYAFMFIYTGKDLPEYHKIESKLKAVLEKFKNKELNH